jgi:hypothetical protein
LKENPNRVTQPEQKNIRIDGIETVKAILKVFLMKMQSKKPVNF